MQPDITTPSCPERGLHPSPETNPEPRDAIATIGGVSLSIVAGKMTARGEIDVARLIAIHTGFREISRFLLAFFMVDYAKDNLSIKELFEVLDSWKVPPPKKYEPGQKRSVERWKSWGLFYSESEDQSTEYHKKAKRRLRKLGIMV